MKKHVSFCIPSNAKNKIKINFCIKSLLDTLSKYAESFSYDIKVCGVDPDLDLQYSFVPRTREARNGFVSRLRSALFQGSISSYLIVYLDDDIVFPEDWAKKFDIFIGNDHSYFSNRILNADNTRYWDRAIGWIEPSGQPSVRMASYDISPSDKSLYQTSGMFCIKPEVLEKEGWNENLAWNQHEDFDLSKRIIHNLNIPIHFDYKNFVWHWDRNYTAVASNVIKGAGVCSESKELTKRILEL